MLRILLVDDCPDTLASLSVLLEAWGHELRTAFNGPTALKIVERFSPDVVILDLAMPGMSGYEVARRFRQQYGRRLALICLTSYGEEEDRQQASDAGCDHFLVKPCEPADLDRILAACELPIQPDGNELSSQQGGHMG
jgi:CheY-like chemotaxis protein